MEYRWIRRHSFPKSAELLGTTVRSWSRALPTKYVRVGSLHTPLSSETRIYRDLLHGGGLILILYMHAQKKKKTKKLVYLILYMNYRLTNVRNQ